MSRMGNSHLQTADARMGASKGMTIGTLSKPQKISYALPKPKVSLMNNRNKADHVRTLLQGVEKPKSEAQAKRSKPNNSDYRANFVFEEEAKEMVDHCDQTFNFKRTFESHYANEFVKMKGNLRLL